jgi:hypothetical protein
VDVGASAEKFKGWMYAIVLDALAADEVTPLGPTSRVSYTLYFRGDDQAKPAVLLSGTASGIVTRGRPGEFVKRLLLGAVAYDISIGLAEKVFGGGGGSAMITGDRRRPAMAYPVRVAGNNANPEAVFALNNRLSVPLSVNIEFGPVAPDVKGLRFDRNVPEIMTDFTEVDAGEKKTIHVQVKPPLVGRDLMATATAAILDPRVAAYEK